MTRSPNGGFVYSFQLLATLSWVGMIIQEHTLVGSWAEGYYRDHGYSGRTHYHVSWPPVAVPPEGDG